MYTSTITKKSVFFNVFPVFALFTAILLTAAPARAGTAALELYYFGSEHCGECLEVKNTLLIPLERELEGALKVHYHNTEDAESFLLMVKLEKQFGIEKGMPQELFFPDTVLLGFREIMSGTRAVVMEFMNDPRRPRAVDLPEFAEDVEGAVNEALRERFSTFTFGAIVLAALVDSVNPCAIATMIFLVSFLAARKKKRGEVLAVGLAFTATVFVTYLMLGVGAFRMITLLDQYRWASLGIKWLAVALAGTVGILSLADGLRFKKSGDTKDIKLKLPKAVKLRINRIISKNLTGSRLIIGAVITGFLVTLLEAVCTGQTYLPTIVLMTRFSDGSLQLIGWLYLIMYNFIFVLPLLAVMIAAYHGMTWDRLAKVTQNNLTLLKILLGIVMLGLATYLALA
jgi:cytochrome c biogenesis protein CcdA